MGFRVVIEDGADVRTVDVRTPVTTVGRSGSCRIRLRSPGAARLHAIFRRSGDELVVESVGRVRVLVDGIPVPRAPLRTGRVVGVGAARLRILATDDQWDAPPAPARPSGAPLRAPDTAPATDGGARWRILRVAAVSAVLHAAVLVALSSFVLWEGRPSAPDVRLEGIASVDLTPDLKPEEETVPLRDPLLDVRPDEAPLPETLPEPVPLREDPFPVPPDPPPRPVPPPRPNVPPTPEHPTPPVAPPVVVEPVVAPAEEARPAIGIGAEAPPIRGESFGKDASAGANAQVAELLEGDAAAGKVLQGVRKAATTKNVWVCRGDYDQAELVLRGLRISHAVCTRETLEQADVPDRIRVLIFNCTGRPLSDDAAHRVARWVANGGHLITTDWGIERLLERGLPGSIASVRDHGRQVLTPDETVEVRAAPGRHALLDGVPRGQESCRWWLEDTSLPFAAVPGADVEILVRSDDLERRHGAGAVAATFPYGDGRVLHLLGHVYQKEGNLRGAYLVQRLVLNFLATALGD